MTTTQSMSETNPTEIRPLVSEPAVRDLPPSCKLVWMVLDRDGEIMRQDIREITGMTRGQVEYAVTRLVAEGIAEKRRYPQNAQYMLYSLSD